MEYERASTSVNMEEPVVEKPDVDSNTASVNVGISPLIIYGKAPRIENNNQPRVTIRYPSLLLNLFISAFPEINIKIVDRVNVIAADQKNGKTDSLYIKATGTHNRKEIVSIRRIVFRIRRISNG